MRTHTEPIGNEIYFYLTDARVAELVDALDLGSSSGDRVGVQVSPLAPIKWQIIQSAWRNVDFRHWVYVKGKL